MSWIVNSKVEKVFLLLGVVFGLIFLITTPPFQSPDEYAHFFRAYTISEGQFIPTQGATLPRSIVEFSVRVSPDPLPGNDQNKQSKKALLEQFQQPFSDLERVPINLNGTIAYRPIAYLPQTLGILAGRFLRLSPILIFYLGRLVNLTAWIGLVFLALRITPIYKWLLLALALMPMSIFQAASNSPDCPLNAFSLLFIAASLRLAFSPEIKVEAQDILRLSIPLILISAIKPAYLVLAGLFLLIPEKRCGGLLRYAVAGLSLLGLAFIPALTWLFLTRGALNISGNGNPADQLQFIQAFPFDFLRILWNSMSGQIIVQWKMWVGVLGWLDTPLPGFIYVLMLPLLVLIALFDHRPDIHIPASAKVFSGFLFLGTWVGIFSVFFVTWTQVGMNPIDGVQGRYFIPVSALLFLPFYNQRFQPPRGWGLITIVSLAFVLIVSLRMLFARFYSI